MLVLFRAIAHTLVSASLVALWMASLALQRRIIVVTRPIGNLGNRLYSFAPVLALAMESRCIVINPSLGHWRSSFLGTRPGLVAMYPPLHIANIKTPCIDRFVIKFFRALEKFAYSSSTKSCISSIRLAPNEWLRLDSEGFLSWFRAKKVIFLDGFLFVSPHLLPVHANSVRQYFTQLDGADATAMKPLKLLRRDCDVVVGVAIRHGDYREWREGKYFFNVSIYVKWILQINTLMKDKSVGFFLCCNDDLDLEGLENIRFEFRAAHDLENRAVLAGCDMIISPPSTYAGWASFQGNIPIQWLNSAEQELTLADFKIAWPMDPADVSFLSLKEVTMLKSSDC
jgi:hypothetical protein